MNIRELPILKYEELCDLINIDPKLNNWRRLVGENENAFDAIFLASFKNYAEAVQLAPASEAHHHCSPGGLLAHTHDCISIALARRKGLQLPLGGTTQEINDKKTLWSLGVFAGCLLHDTGKLLSSIRIMLNKPNSTQRWWTPHDEPLLSLAPRIKVKTYAIDFVKTPYAYHTHVAPTLIDMLPRSSRGWLAEDVPLFKELCAHLRGDRFESGIIGTLAEGADRESVAKNLQIPIPAQRFSNTLPLIERYLGFIRTGIQEGELALNRNGGIGYCDDEGYVYFVCRSLADRLIAKCEELGINDTPRDQVRIYDILQDHGYALPTPDGKAIWTVNITGPDFKHTFTCLKFEARRLTVPTRPISAFAGHISIVEKTEKKAEAAKTPTPANDEAPAKNIDIEEKTALKAQITQEAPPAKEHEEKTHAPVEIQAPVNETQKIQEAASNRSDAEAEKITNDAEEIQESEEITPPEKKKGSLVFAAAKAASQRKSAGSNETEKESFAPEKITQETEKEPENKTQEAAEEPENKILETAVAEDSQSDVIDSIVDTTLASQDVVESGTEPKVIEYTQKLAMEMAEERAQRAARVLSSVAKAPPDWQGLSIETPNLQNIFLAWLKTGITSKTIPINNPRAMAHIVEEGLFLVCPSVFKQFLIAHSIPEASHTVLSKRFDRLKICLPTSIGGNVFSYWAVGESRHAKISGRVVPFSFIFDPTQAVPDRNIYLQKDKPRTEAQN